MPEQWRHGTMVVTMCPSRFLSESVCRRPAAPYGFTLVELLVVSAIAATLVSMAVPSVSTMLTAQRTAAITNRFLSSLHLTRGEAIKRNGRVVMCKSADAGQCTTTGGWEQGWLMFHDRNNNALRDSDEPVIQQQVGTAASLRLSGNTPVASYVSYAPSGRARLVSGAFQAGTFTICPTGRASGDDAVRKIILGGPGRPRLLHGTAADCS
jgi:type IV fimbrial biogenesis protein FimT